MLMWSSCRNQSGGSPQGKCFFSSIELVSVMESQSIRAERALRGYQNEMNTSQLADRELAQVSLPMEPGHEPLCEGRKVVTSLPEPNSPSSEHTVHGT